jgi:ABC-2 type transport system permease protein
MFWSLAFPLIFVVVFGLFNFDDPSPIEITVVDHAQDPLSQRLVQELQAQGFLDVQLSDDEAAARQAVADGDAGYVLIIPAGLAQQVMPPASAGASLTLVYDDSQIQTNSIVQSILTQFLSQANMAIQGAQPLLQLEAQGVIARNVTYFDFAMPGFIGMGVMTYGIIGIASVMALYRQQKIFKRIKATPLKVRTFFTAQVLAYLVISLLQAAIILSVGVFVFGANVYGNVVWMFPLIVLANLSFLNIGFIVGSFAKTVEAASGLGNVVAMPMMFFSGVFFPTDSLPTVLSNVVEYLPLTPLLDALRGVMVEAKPLWDFPAEIALLVGWVVVSGVVAIRIFRFE